MYAILVPVRDDGGVRLESVAWDDPRAAMLRAAMDDDVAGRYADQAAEYAAARADPAAARVRVEAAEVIATLIAVTADGTPVGHAALRWLDGEIEVKRVYVDKASRGTGVSSRLMLALEDIARDHGATRLILQTGDRQPEAVRLYEKLGYRRIPVYPPYDAWPRSSCFGKTL